MDTKDKEVETDQVVTSDDPYGSKHKKATKFKLPPFLAKSSHLFTAIVVVVLVAGIGTYLLVTSQRRPLPGQLPV